MKTDFHSELQWQRRGKKAKKAIFTALADLYGGKDVAKKETDRDDSDRASRADAAMRLDDKS